MSSPWLGRWANRGGRPTAAPAGLWEPDERVVEFRKTEYNRLQAELDMVRAGLPLEAASK